jgi:hypothetical protein
MYSLKIITVATKSDYYLPYLKKSIEENGGELTVLGYGEEWQGFNWRFSIIMDYLKTLNKKVIVCIVDGYDVICCRNLKEIPNIFLKIKEKYDCKMIVGEDKLHMGTVMNAVTNLLYTYLWGGKCKNKFLNAGTYIGFSDDILNIISNIYSLTNSNTSDDQILMKKYCRLHPNEIYIDSDSELFLTIDKPYSEVDNLVKIENGRVYYNNSNSNTNSQPFFIHGPGGTYLDNLLIMLGHENNGEVKEKIKNDFYKKCSLYLSPSLYNSFFENNNYMYFFFIIIILILIIIVFLIYYKNKFIKNITKKRKLVNKN